MKQIIILLSISMLSCKGQRGDKVIVTKSYTTFSGDEMPAGLCRYYYQEWSGLSEATCFTDSCNKYSVGDTIVGKKIIN